MLFIKILIIRDPIYLAVSFFCCTFAPSFKNSSGYTRPYRMYSFKNVAERVGDAEHESGAGRFLKSTIRYQQTKTKANYETNHPTHSRLPPLPWRLDHALLRSLH